MYAVATFLIVALMSMLFTRIITGALITTGMPPETASFQARSAFTGAGFTTTEAENVVNHTERRKLISLTMFVGNLGVPTLVVTVLLGLLAPGPGETSTRLLVLSAGLAVIVFLAFTKPVTRWFVSLGQKATRPLLQRALTGQAVAEYYLSPETAIYSLPLSEDVPLRSIRGVQQAMPHLKVLGVRPAGRLGGFVSGPPVDVQLQADDELIVLADQDEISALMKAREAALKGEGPSEM